MEPTTRKSEKDLLEVKKQEEPSLMDLCRAYLRLVEEDKAKKQPEEETLATEDSDQIMSHDDGFLENIDPIVGQIQPITMLEKKTHRSTLNYQMVTYEKYDPQTQRTETPFSLLDGDNAGSKDRTVEPYFERGKDMVDDLSGFDNETRKDKHQQGKENGSKTEMDICAYQVFDQMLGRGNRVNKKKKRGSTHNGSCDSTGLETPCTKPVVKKRFHRARFKQEKKCDYGYVISMLQIQRSLGDKRFYQFVEAGSTKNKPATKPSSSVQVRSADKLGKTLQSQYFPMFYQNTYIFGDVNKLVVSVGSDEENGCVAGRANQVWEPGGSLSPKSQLSWLERPGDVRILNQSDAYIEACVGVELLEEMLKLDSEVTVVTLFPEDSTRQLRSSFKHICRGVVTDEVQKKLRGDDIRNEQDSFSENCGVLVFSDIASAELRSRQSVVGMCKHQRGTIRMRQTLEICHGVALLESLKRTESGRDTLQRATNVLFIREHSGNHGSSFFIYGRFGSPRPPERSFNHLILFQIALHTSGFSLDDSNTLGSRIHKRLKPGLSIEDKDSTLASEALLQLLPNSTDLKENIDMGFTENLSSLEGYIFIMVVMGRLSKHTHLLDRRQHSSATDKIFLLVQGAAYCLKPSSEARISPTVPEFRLRMAMEELVITVSILNLLVGKEVLQAETNASLNTRVNIKSRQEGVMVKGNSLLDLDCTREWQSSMKNQFPQYDLEDKVSFNGAGIDTCTRERPNMQAQEEGSMSD